jgi:hypothetical protein
LLGRQMQRGRERQCDREGECLPTHRLFGPLDDAAAPVAGASTSYVAKLFGGCAHRFYAGCPRLPPATPATSPGCVQTPAAARIASAVRNIRTSRSHAW